MRVSRILCLCIAAALPQLAPAADETNPAGLGIVDAVLDFCSRVDPRNEESFDSLKLSVQQGHSDANLKRTPEYKHAYQLTTRALQKIPREDVIEYCAAGSRHEHEERPDRDRRPDDDKRRRE